MKILNYYNDWQNKVDDIFLHKDFGLVGFTISRQKNEDIDFLISSKFFCDFKKFLGNRVIVLKKLISPKHYIFDMFNMFQEFYFLFKERGSYSNLVIINFVIVCDFIFVLVFKLFNKSAKIILKLDTNIEILENRLSLNNSSVFRQFEYYCFKKLLNASDIIMFENENCESFIKKIVANNAVLMNVPNGVSSGLINNYYNVKWKDFKLRKNNILIIGSLKVEKKNIKWLLESYSYRFSLLADWNFIFVCGEKLDLGYKNLNFVESLSKSDIYNLYSESKILLNVSSSEGFPISFSEGIYFGLNLYSTNVGGADHYMKFNNNSVIMSDPKLLIERLISDLQTNSNLNFGQKSFCNQISWEYILDQIK